MVLDAIKTYFERGGQLEFTFAGGGVYTDHLRAFAGRFSNFHYLGLVSPTEAAQINANYTWALLPIEDDVTRFAFPSKSSSYVCAGANILAICGEQSGVAQWVQENQLGLVIKPHVEAVVAAFFNIEKGLYQELSDNASREALTAKLRFEVFLKALNRIVLE